MSFKTELKEENSKVATNELMATKTYLAKEEIVSRIKTQLKVTRTSAKEIFDIWEEYFLIGLCSDFKDELSIGVFQIWPFYEYGQHKSAVIVTSSKWLEKNFKALVDNLKDYIG